jgi:hypothetical protein
MLIPGMAKVFQAMRASTGKSVAWIQSFESASIKEYSGRSYVHLPPLEGISIEARKRATKIRYFSCSDFVSIVLRNCNKILHSLNQDD